MICKFIKYSIIYLPLILCIFRPFSSAVTKVSTKSYLRRPRPPKIPSTSRAIAPPRLAATIYNLQQIYNLSYINTYRTYLPSNRKRRRHFLLLRIATWLGRRIDRNNHAITELIIITTSLLLAFHEHKIAIVYCYPRS